MGALLQAVLEAILLPIVPGRARPDGPGRQLQRWLGTPFTLVIAGLWIMTGAAACEQTLFARGSLWQPFLIAAGCAFVCGVLLNRPRPQPSVGALLACAGPVCGIAAGLAGILIASSLPSLPGWG